MLSHYSVRKPYTVIVGIILVIVLGYISFQNMTTDLLPSMNLPYVVVYTTYIGATPEQVESTITRPMEAALATLNDVKQITSSSRDNVSVVIMQFNDGANMDTALIELSAQLDQLSGGWDDAIGSPVAMKLNPDMLPVAILSVSRDDMDILELSDYVEDELIPAFEGLNGVASASASGVIDQRIDVTIEQSRIDVLNSAILREVDEQLADVEQQLNEGQAAISDGKRQLARAKQEAYAQIDAALSAIESGEGQLAPAIEQLTQQRAELAAQREPLALTVSALEALVNLDDDQKAQAQALAQQVLEGRAQLAELEKQLSDAEAAGENPLETQRQSAQTQRDALAAERDELQQYADDLRLMDPEALRSEIAALEAQTAGTQASLDAASAELSEMQAARAQTQAQADDLSARIAAQDSATDGPTEAPEITLAPLDDPTEAPTDAPTDVPTDVPTDAPTDAPTDTPTEVPTDPPTDSPTDTPADGSGAGETQDTSETAKDSSNGDDTDDASHGDPTQTPAATDTLPTDAPEDAGQEASDDSGDQDGTDPDGTGTDAGSQSRAASDARALLRGAAHADEPDVDALRDELAAVQESLARQDAAIAEKSAEVETLQSQLSAEQTTLSAKREALETLDGDSENVQSRIDEAERQIAALDARIAMVDLEIAALDTAVESGGDASTLRQAVSTLNEQISAAEESEAYQSIAALSDPEALQSQYDQAKSGLDQLDAGLAQMDAALEKLNNGVIPGGFIEGMDQDTPIADAKSQLVAARAQADSGFAEAEAQLADADSQLAAARAEFEEKRDEALENAGIDGIITMQTVAGLIGAQNFSMPAGYVHDADNEQVLVRVGDKFASLDELKRMKLFSLGLDSVDEIRLLDVAKVELADNRDEVFTKLNGADGILLSLDKQSTFSTAEVSDTVIAKAKALMAENPELHIVDLMNQGEYISIIVDSVLQNLLSGGGLAILILLLFLMDWRPTLTVAFSIPISVVIAFVCMYFSGITLNVLSLSGLSLGIGMLVDNSIVSIENIYRLHEEEGYPLLRACVEGVKSVSGALFASTLTTICVFLPIVFVQGMARDLFADMGLTIAFSLLASLLVAMTVVPMMCSFLMRRSKPRRHVVFSKLQAGYTALLRGALRVKPLVLLAALGLLVFSGMQVPRMGISFMPEVSSRQMSATLTPAPEMTTAQARQLAMDVMEEMLAVPGVDSVGLMGGGGGMLAGLSGGAGGMSYYIIVDESAGRRNRDIAADMSAIADRLDADLAVQASTMDISMLTGSGISVEITGDDIETLQSIARDVAELARQTPGTVDVNDGNEDAVPEMRIVVDKEKAIDEGLTTAQVLQFVAQKLSGAAEISDVTLDGKNLSIYLVEGRNQGLRPEDLQDMEIESATQGETKMVRIGDIADIRETQSLSTISRSSQRRMVTVSFGIAEGYSANLVSDDFAARLDQYDVPAGYTAALAGENETVLAIMKDLIYMLLVAILLIFLIMVAQFQSFKSPIIVMFTIPLAFTGGLLALILTGMDLSIVSMLGFLVLSGVVVNNGIVFIDCVNQLRIAGMEKKDALVEAGRQRLRPILMTAMTTILGMSTMALGQGTGAEMMQPMAVVSIGGLTYATLMTLFVVPVLYDLVNGKKMKAREIQMIREAAGMNNDDVLDDIPAPGAADAASAGATDVASGPASTDKTDAAFRAVSSDVSNAASDPAPGGTIHAPAGAMPGGTAQAAADMSVDSAPTNPGVPAFNRPESPVEAREAPVVPHFGYADAASVARPEPMPTTNSEKPSTPGLPGAVNITADSFSTIPPVPAFKSNKPRAPKAIRVKMGRRK